MYVKKKLTVQNKRVSAYYDFSSLHKSLTKTALQENISFILRKIVFLLLLFTNYKPFLSKWIG